MKLRYLITALLIFLVLGIEAQPFNINQGGTMQTGYFASIPYQNIAGKILIQATIKGKTYTFIFDTGAPDIISKQVYNELKLPVLAKIPFGSDSSVLVSADISLGGIIFNNTPTLVSSSPLFGCINVDGIVGSNVLRNSIVHISPKDKMIYLSDDETKFSLNKKQSSDIFLTPDQSSPFIWIKIKNRKPGNEQLLFDTGADDFYALALSHLNIFKKHDMYSSVLEGYGNNQFGFLGTAPDTVQYRVTVPEVKINGAVFKNVSAQTTTGADSRIGAKILEYGSVTIDYKAKKFYFEPFSDTVNINEGRWPFALTFKDKKIVVGLIWNGPLKAKLDIGDQIVSINEINLEKFDPCSFFVKDLPALKLKNSVTIVFIDKTGQKQTLTVDNQITAQ